MDDFDTNDILGRIGDAEIPGNRHSRLLTFRRSDESECPIGWSPSAELTDQKRAAAFRILSGARRIVAETVAGDEDALAELFAYVTGLHEDLRPTSWHPDLMDEDDLEYFRSDLREAMKAALHDDDAFRVAYGLRRKLSIEGDMGIIDVAAGLIRRTAEVRAQPDVLDRAAEIVGDAAIKPSGWLRKVAANFLEEQRESRDIPSPPSP